VIPGAGGDGGGVYYGLNSTSTLSQCAFTGNTADSAGGGIYCGDNITLISNQCTLTDNTATLSGGGIYYGVECVSQLSDCVFSGNSSSEDGGGILYSVDNSITVTDCNFADNSADYGGALYIDENCSGTITDSELFGNDAAEDGGGIYLSDSDELAISDCDISQNLAARGAGIYGIDCPGTSIVGCTINNNEAYRVVIYYEYYEPDPNDPNVPLNPEDPSGNPNDPNVIVVVKQDRSGIAEGGGIFSFAGPALIKDSEISHNTATTSGGGMYLAGDYPESVIGPELRNCLVTNNAAGRDGAGISANWQVKPKISNCTIVDNELIRIPSYGGGLYCSYESEVEVIDSIIWGNTGNYEGSQIAVASGDLPYPLPSTVKITYSDIELIQLDANEPGAGDPNMLTGPTGDPCNPDYFIYGVLDATQYMGGSYGGAHGPDGFTGPDGIDRLIFVSNTYDFNDFTFSTMGYIVTVTIPAGTHSDTHPANPYRTGPIAPRTFTLERSFDLGEEHYIGDSQNAFYVDIEKNEIYIGATYSEGILKYVFDPNAANPVAGGPAGNYVFDSIVAPSCPGWPDTLAYDPNNDIWYAGNWDYEIYKYDGSQGPDGNWELAFTSFPYAPVGGRLQHHDGLAFVNGYLFLADMYGDWIMQYLPDGTLVNVYYHEPLGRDLEGMGWGALGHFWSGSFEGKITEFGGGALQIGVGGVLPTTPPIYVEEGCTLNWWEPNEPNNFLTWDVNSWDPNSHNIAEDPLFVAGYYLSQPVAGRQDPNSPCVDAGSGDVSDPNIGMEQYTTRVDGANDVNKVDMGYHYSEGLTQYYLTVSVVDANGMVVDPNLAYGYVDPNWAIVYEGYGDNVVTLTAYPIDPNYRVRKWTGTDNDANIATINTVTVNSDKHVTVEFELTPVYQLTVLVPGGNGSVAVDPNGYFYRDRTVVTLTATPDPNYRLKAWTGTNNDLSFALTNTVTINSDKTVTVEFEMPRKIEVSGGADAILDAINIAKPGDSLIVAAGTYNGGIDFQGKELRLFSTNPDDPNIVAQTIIDCQQSGRAFTFNNGEGPETVIDGFTIINGSLSSQPGGAIYCGSGTSPTIVNLIISNCRVSFSSGGAIFIDSGSTPSINNVTINDCSVYLGVGGGVCINTETSITLSYCTISNCRAFGGSGGAVYAVAGSSPTFVGCNFSSSRAANGGGLFFGLDSTSTLSQCSLADNTAFYDGGAIFYSSGCVSEMNDCTLTGNSANEDGGGIGYAADNSIMIVGSNFARNSAQYGGGLYFDPSCSGTIAESVFLNNIATEDGGAIYLSDSDELAISDCRIAYNSAARGGGIYGIDCSDSTIIGCSITNNEATQGAVWYEFYNRDPNDPNLPIGPPDPNGSLDDPNYIAVPQTSGTGIAQGGGIYSFEGPSLIADCNISYNTANTSGGGVYLAGDFSPELRNCLIADNRAGRDGGGISANWQVNAFISNCTIADNEVMGLLSFGGGLYCSYESNVEVIDSIIWNNLGSPGTEGYQVAVASGDLSYPLPSTVNITYSDIGPSEVGAGPTLDPNLLDPNMPDYFIYSTFDTSVDHNWPGSYGIDGWVGSDGIHRIIHYSGPKEIDLINSIAYIHTVTVPPGADFHSHPSNPYSTGPIAPRTRTLERTFDIGVSLSHGNEFWVDAATNEIYIGAARYGIRKFVFDPNANNPVAGGPAGNYVFDSIIAPASPIDEDGWTTQTLAYDPDNDIWYAGAISYYWYEADRTIWKYDGSQGPDGQWEIAFTYEEGDHHDGMEFINGYLFLADNQGDYIFQYTPDGTLVNTFYFEPLEHMLEGMGFGALEHFWVGSHGEVEGVGSRITELGGGLLQMGLQGGILGFPIYVEQSCTLDGWDWDPNTHLWDPNNADSNNISKDPLFVAGYYLSQIAADQDVNSPCVDSGSADANEPNIGMHTYTTRTDGVNDVNIVDMGYHYSQGLTRYVLTVSVVDANGVVVVEPNLAHGYVEPNTAVVYEGYEDNVIELTAYPGVSYKVKKWTGTDDDTITGRHNTVTLTEDKHVTIEFEQAPLYDLFLYVIGTDANGTLEPDTPWIDYDPNLGPYGAYQYYAGTEVTLVAKADPNYEVRYWFGTDDDSSKESNNIVTIDSNEYVAVEFGRVGYNIINLYDENMVLDPRSPFPTIQAAVDAAGNNYTVELTPGVYFGVGNYDVNLRAGLDPNEVRPITVRSTDPTDAETIESTIINCRGSGRAFIFNSGEEPNSYTISGLTISNGFAAYGGAILCDGASPTIRNCRITNNYATGDGGAIYLTNASPVIINTEITGNIAGGFGGGIYAQADSVPEIINCLIAFNYSSNIGGAMYLYESDAIIRLSTIAYNYGLALEENNYGPIPIGGVAARDSDPDISHCIIGLNGGYYYGPPGDYLYGYWGSNLYAGDDLYECSATYSCIENGDGGDGNIDDDPLWISGGLGPFYLSQTQSGQPATSPCVNAGEQYILQDLQSTYNLGNMTTSIMNYADVGYADMGYHYPFFTGPPIQYSLVVVVTGNGRLEYTYYDYYYTDINDYDVNTVVGPNESPAVAYLRPGTSVQLRAIPDPNYRVFSWTGTNDDTYFGLTNSVTMYGSRYVLIEFERAVKRVLDVAVDDQYPYIAIQEAIDDARDGDVVLLHSGTYAGTGFEVIGKNITITGTNPDDPDVVASTIIDCTDEINGGIHILGTPGGTSVLSGVTIMNSHFEPRRPYASEGAGARGTDGADNLPYAYAYDMYGTGVFDMRNVYVRSNAALTVIGNHIITNCIIRDCSVTGGEAFYGNAGNAEYMDGGNGGNGGFAGGAGIFIGDIYDYYYEDVLIYDPNYPNDVNYAMYDYEQHMISWGSSPLIKNCIIDNCVAIAGDGADGGTSGARATGGSGGVPGRALGAGIYCDVNTSPTFENCTVTNCSAVGGNGGNGGDGEAGYGFGGYGGLSYADPLQPDPESFSAYGAGVYCGIGCEPNFINCTISDNVTDGSVSGIGGLNMPSYRRQQPLRNYNIPSYGAGLYCDSGCSSTFTNCTFQGNRTTYYGDLYSGYGGGVCFDGGKDYDYYLGYGFDYTIGSSSYYSSYLFDANFVSTVSATLTDCRFSGNSASVGGGLYAVVSDVNIVDCNFADNTSYIGGGLCFNESLTCISGSTIQRNIVSADADPNVMLDPNDPNGPSGVEFGAGGGIYCLATDTLMRTCDISYNFASGSGGGVYLAVDPNFESGGDQVLKNCLITNNIAARDGGGISVNWYAQPVICNCTIADNNVSEPNGYGGGLYCSYESHVDVNDSIIWGNWGNVGIKGSQIALCSGDLPYSLPSSITVSYSDVQGWKNASGPNRIDANAVFVDPGIDANDFVHWDFNTVIDDDPLFVSGYYLSQIAAGQSADSNCIDAGSADASLVALNDINEPNISLAQYTTRIDGVNDVNIVDMGYHYPIVLYRLTAYVAGGNGSVVFDPNGRPDTDPNSRRYNQLATVTLKSKPDPNYRVQGWYDVNDVLLSTGKSLEVLMDSDKVFKVQYELPNIVPVFGGGNAIQQAVDAALSGDTLIVAAGTYDGDINLQGKDITVVSANPDDPGIIAQTIIDGQQSGRGFIFNSNEGPNTVINGFTVINGSVTGQGGGGIYVDVNSSPTIKNVTINNCSVTGADGGAIYVDANSSPRFINCLITNCSADNGGGVHCDVNSSPLFYHCTFGNNSAAQMGGAMLCDPNVSITVEDCNLIDNSASFGGALYCAANCSGAIINTILERNYASEDGGAIYLGEANDLSVTDCNISYNTALHGAGLYSLGSLNLTISGCELSFNQAPLGFVHPNTSIVGQGGGMYCFATEAVIRDCVLNENTANTSGGGMYLAGESDYIEIINCLITNNAAGRDGGGISANWYAEPNIANCTFASNAAPGTFGQPGYTGFGGGLYCSYYSKVEVIDSILSDNNALNGLEIAVATGFEPATLKISYSDVQRWQIDANAVFVDPGIDANNFVYWDSNTVIEDDPLFVSGYYLSHVDAGQSADSNCIDAGSGDVNDPNIDMAGYTTRIDGVNDVNIVDMGYHYPIVLYRLTAYVAGGNGSVVFDPNGRPDTDPNSRRYNQFAIVTLRSKPDPNYRVQGWYDVNDVLLSTGKSIEVVMDSDKVFKVRYELPNVVQVFGGGNAIQQAVDAALSGDTLIVAAGTYDGDINLQGKDITLVSTNPDDPVIIAQTIIDGQLSGRGFIFNSNEGPNTIIDGFMIINGSVTGEGGGGIYVDVNSSPTIKNVAINNCTAIGADGGAIYVDANSSPRFINCLITNCSADNGGGAHCDVNSSPLFYHCTFGNNSAAQVGGGILCDPNVSITVEDCNFTDNSANFGGALYCAANCSGEIINTILERNDANEDGGAIYFAEANDLLVTDCNISYNTALHGAGIYSLGSLNLTISGCELAFNQAPLGFFDPNDPNALAVIGQGGGMCCLATEALIRDCVLTHNSANTSGGGIYLRGESDYIEIINCLIINNLAGRDGGGISVNWRAEPNIVNCTFASNAAPGTFGQLGYTGFGGGLYCSYHSNVEVIDSIFWNNYALMGFEIAVATGFEFDPIPAKLMLSHSDIRRVALSVWVDSGCILWDPNDPSKRTPLDVSHPDAPWLGSTNNIDLDPLFVTGPLGSYYLSHIGAGQDTDSPCIDKGSELALYRGLTERYTTRTDNLPDAKEVDMGYHYTIRPETEECRLCDLDYDGVIDFNDLAVFVSHWLDDGCLGSDAGCKGTDFTFDTFVDFADYAFFANCWLVEDVCAPVPNPSEWLIRPYMTTTTAPYTISMTARTAFDGWGWPVQYNFKGVVGSSHESGWQDSPTWQDTGLDPNVYGYRVQAKDALGNETLWSVIGYAGTGDITPPAPEPAWDYFNNGEPTAISPSSITMTATISSDESGVEYYFEATTPGGHDSGWQDEPNYTDVNLVPNTMYCYRVAARDKSANANQTNWFPPPPMSATCVTTLPPPDVNAPIPDPMLWDMSVDANGSDGRPREIYGGGDQYDYYATMRADQNTVDIAPLGVAPSGVEFYFLCTNNGDFSSGWISFPAGPPFTYTVKIGRSGQLLKFKVKACDTSAKRNETAYSEEWMAMPP